MNRPNPSPEFLNNKSLIKEINFMCRFPLLRHTIGKPMKKLYHRINRVSEKLQISIEDLNILRYECLGSMGTKEFFRYFVTDEKFRKTIINRYLYNMDE